jgi:hypothetical protein
VQCSVSRAAPRRFDEVLAHWDPPTQAALHCTTLHCTTLHCTALHCTQYTPTRPALQ